MIKNNFIKTYLNESKEIVDLLDFDKIDKAIKLLQLTKKNKGRVFILGVGGSAANASHFVNDLRKIGNFEAYSPSDNISELTARTNDEGWETIFEEWLKVSNLNQKDLVIILSVGGGDNKKKISVNILKALKYASIKKSKSISITGNRNGYSYKNSSCSILINVKNKARLTPHAEEFQSIIWHLIVSHPKIAINKTKWESVKGNK